MNWYKKAQSKYPSWIAREMQRTTNNYQKPLEPNIQRMLPKIKEWALETSPDFENLTLEEAVKQTTYYNYAKAVEKPSPESLVGKDNPKLRTPRLSLHVASGIHWGTCEVEK